MPQAAIKHFFLDNPNWPPPPAGEPGLAVASGQLYRSHQLHKLGKLVLTFLLLRAVSQW